MRLEGNSAESFQRVDELTLHVWYENSETETKTSVDFTVISRIDAYPDCLDDIADGSKYVTILSDIVTNPIEYQLHSGAFTHYFSYDYIEVMKDNGNISGKCKAHATYISLQDSITLLEYDSTGPI